MYDNKTPRGGRPNVDEVVMVKLPVLQQWYGLSDPELERQANDRISFRRFLGYPRVHVKMVFACLCFNLVQLGTLAARS